MPSPPDFAAQCALAKGEPLPANVRRLVFAILAKAQGPITSGELVIKTGARYNTVYSALWVLKKEGLVIRHGDCDQHSTWELKTKQIKELPERRGQHAASKNNLRSWREKLRGGGARPAEVKPHNQPPIAATELEKAWGWFAPCVSEVDDASV